MTFYYSHPLICIIYQRLVQDDIEQYFKQHKNVHYYRELRVLRQAQQPS